MFFLEPKYLVIVEPLVLNSLEQKMIFLCLLVFTDAEDDLVNATARSESACSGSDFKKATCIWLVQTRWLFTDWGRESGIFN